MEFVNTYHYVYAYQAEVRAEADRHRRVKRSKPDRGRRFPQLRSRQRRRTPAARQPRLRAVD